MTKEQINKLTKNINDYAQKCRDARSGKIKFVRLDGNQIDIIPKVKK
jgi:hypothetical protein